MQVIPDRYTVDIDSWKTNGYLIFREVFSRSQVDTINAFMNRVWDHSALTNSAVTLDAFLDSSRYQRMLFSEASDETRFHPYKLNDLYLESEEIRSFVLAKDLRKVFSQLLNGEALVCNSLNLGFGAQQCDHIDTLYTLPRVKNKLVVSWIALDEVDESNGPVKYFPGSHKIPPYYFSNGKMDAIDSEMHHFQTYIEDELQKLGIIPKRFFAQPGDVLIWHGQLVHGGSRILNTNKQRRSIVTHYFRKKDYKYHFWRIKESENGGYYYNRKHPKVESSEH
ncbi:MAG: hypothetical protein GKR91_09370 [Pseudomonadales bacterium]|nr:hypothetical protein [Pseudomonadales bacterium]